MLLVAPVGMWATLLRCPHTHRRARILQDDGVHRAHNGVVTTCRIGRHGADLNRQVRIDAVPHTVPSTHAGALFQALRTASTSGARWRGRNGGAFLSVCPLPCSSAHLQLLRSRPDLLCWRLCRTGAARKATRSRTALPSEPPWPRRSCLACPQLSGAAKECDASGFTTAATG